MHSAIYDEELLSVVRKEVPEMNELPDNFVVRPLKSIDFDKGYCELLSQLTFVGDVTAKFSIGLKFLMHPMTFVFCIFTEKK